MIFKPDSSLVHALHPSCNAGDRRKGRRADMIVLHYTGMATAEQAVKWLSDPRSKVSCHYVIDERGHITQLVAETQRAWHAGASHWAGEADINSASIGIEIQNPGHEHGYPDFGRKIDPGEKFDWAYLAKHGVGRWIEPAPPKSDDCVLDDDEGARMEALELMRAYGYGTDDPGRDKWFWHLIRTFQMHFRPERADGRLDTGTLDTLRRLVAALPASATS
jgi:N-acetylmuramoyl-L-alanine amidase